MSTRPPPLARPAVLAAAFVAVAATLPLLPGGAVAAPDDPVVVARLEWEPGYLGSHRPRALTLTDTPPEGLVVPPSVKQAKFGQLPLGTTAVLNLVLDIDPEHRRIWVDRDFDNDLTDEGDGLWEPHGNRDLARLTLLVPYADEPHPVAVEMDFFHIHSAAPEAVSACLHVHRAGTAALGGRLRPVAMTDGGTDMGYDNAENDWIYLDLDGNGVLDTGHDSHERILIGTPFRLGDEGWVAKPTSGGAHAIEFTRLKDAPPEPPRAWNAGGIPASGEAQSPPAETLEELLRRVDEERELPYAQRHATLTLLGRVPADDAFDRLLRIADESGEDVNVRAAAARALGNPAYLASRGTKLMRLCDANPGSVAAAALQALHTMGHPDRESVYRKALGDSDTTIVGAAARHLAYIGTPAAVKAVADAAASASQPAARFQAYIGLRSTPDGPPEKLMLAAAESDYAQLRAQALRDLLFLSHPKTRKLALEAAQTRPTNYTLDAALLEVLGAFGDEECVTAMLERAIAPSPMLGPQLIEALSYLRSDGARTALIDALQHKETAVRTVSAQALAGWRDKTATDALIKQVKREKDADAAAAMLEALGDHQDPAAESLLLKAASSKNDVLRSAGIRALARLGVGLPKVRDFFEKLLNAKSWEDRILAIDAAASSGDESLGRKVLASLDHDQWQVRLCVAEALRKIRFREAVEPLVVQLERETEQRVRGAIGQTLFELTGMHLYDEAALWRRWFTEHGATFVMPVDIPSAPVTDAGTRGGFFGIPVDSERIVFLIDQSGSMQVADHTPVGGETRTRLDAAVAEVLRAIGQMRDGARVNVILFHSTSQPWEDRLVKLGAKTRAALTKHLQRQRPTGGTNIYDPLEEALADGDIDTVMLLSDGAPGAGKYVATDDILRGVRRHNQTRRIAIHCVSLGRDSDLLKRLAAENGGQYVRR